MNPEVAMLKGELAEAKRKYSEYDIEAKGLIAQIRFFLNPYESDVTNLKTDQALVGAKRLNFVRTEMVKLKSKIDQISENFE